MPGTKSFTDAVVHVRAEADKQFSTRQASTQQKLDNLTERRASLCGHTDHITQLRLQSLGVKVEELEREMEGHARFHTSVHKAITIATDMVNRGYGDPDALSLELFSVLQGHPMVVPVTDDLCPKCGLSLCLTVDSQLSCVVCGYAIRYLDATAAAMAYGNDVEYSSFMYKRIGHLRKHMDHYQGKVRTEIPECVLRETANVIVRKFDVVSVDNVELWMVRPSLKELDRMQKELVKKGKCDFPVSPHVDYRDLYKYYTQIYGLLTGRPPPRFTPHQEQHIYMMFKALQVPFEMYKPKDRKNFLNYTYVIFKVCQKLGYKEHLRNFCLMKDGDKLKKVDHLMKRIFEYNGWEWIPTPTAPRKKNK
jgi:hypothetical protein